MCVCVCVYIYTHIHIYTYIHIHRVYILYTLNLILRCDFTIEQHEEAQKPKTTEIQLTVWFSKQCSVIGSERCLPRRVPTPELILRKTRGTWYRQREMTARVCDREHLSASVRKITCVHQVREDVCERMWCVTLHFHADTEGPLFSQCEREQDGRLSPQAQISLSYLTQQILCKSSRSVIPQPLQESSSFVALHILSFFLPSILSLPLWVWE